MRGLELVRILGREDQQSRQAVRAEVEFHQGFGLQLFGAGAVEVKQPARGSSAGRSAARGGVAPLVR